MYCEHIDETTKQVFGLTSKQYDGYIDIGEVEQAWDGAWYLKGYSPEKSQEVKEQEVRVVRNSYLETYVDPYQLVIRWGNLTEQEQTDLVNYRQYLLDYTAGESWWEENPMDFESWKKLLDENTEKE